MSEHNNWEERFDEKFKLNGPEIVPNFKEHLNEYNLAIKQFISEEIERAKADTLNEVIEMVEEFPHDRCGHSYCQSIPPILNQLKAKRDE